MTFINFTPSLTRHDAVSTDAFHCYLSLKNAGQDSKLFAEFFDPFYLEHIASKNHIAELVSNEKNTIIIHHSTYSRIGEELFDRAKARIFIRYHNITPARFLAGPNESPSNATFHRLHGGRLQNQKFGKSDKPFTLLAGSHYNARDFQASAEKEIPFIISPPFHLVHEMSNIQANKQIAKDFSDFHGINLLYVSRISPNKGQLQLIDVVDQYLRYYGHQIRLILIGKFQDRNYGQRIFDRINFLNLSDHVSFKEDINFADLVTYYKNCSLFLLPSQHEGFGVPIIEAQYCSLPVIAYAKTAIPETAGQGALLLDSLDPKLWAAAIHYCRMNPEFGNHLRELGAVNFERFSFDRIEQKFLHAVLP